MKKQGKQVQRRLDRKTNKPWKWMAGATAATAAGAASAQGGMITVNLVGNLITSTSGNFLNADLTGDGKPDLTITNALYSVVNITPSLTNSYVKGRPQRRRSECLSQT